MPANITTADVLTQESIRRTVNEAVEENLVFGQLYRDLDISDIPNDTIKLPQDDDNMAEPELIPENTEFPRDENDVSTISATVHKYGLELAISMEAEQDSLLDVVDMNVRKKARKMQELLNKQSYTELNNNLHTNSPVGDNGGTLDFEDVTQGIKELRNSGRNPNLFIVSAQGEKDILNDPDFNRATDLGDDVVQQGVGAIGTFAGLTVVVDNDGHIGASTPDGFVVDTSDYGYFVHKGGIQTDEYMDESTRSRVFQIFSRHTHKAENSDAAIKVQG